MKYCREKATVKMETVKAYKVELPSLNSAHIVCTK